MDQENADDLVRRQEFGLEQVEDGDCLKVRVEFPDFGLGNQRRPDFAVELEWLDIRNCLAAFIEMGHEEARYIHRLMKLAEAVEDAGWAPNDPPTADFIDAVRPQSN